MGIVEASAEVGVPIRMAYNQWTQFESFPHFMEGVQEVRQLDETHNRWLVEVSGVRRQFDTEITEQRPDERISWQTVGGEIQQTGNVSFDRLDDDHTRVTVQVSWEPDGLAEKAVSAAGLDTRQVKTDVERFKDFIENRTTETGAWRGEVGPQVEAEPVEGRDPM